MNELRNIIFNTNEQPTIINNDSNFVVVTYWWGRNNLNNNTARPCVSYYEDFFKKVINFSINTIATLNKLQSSNIESLKENLENLENIIETREFKNLIKRKINEYYTNIYQYAKIPENSSNKYDQALQFLEKNKLSGKTPQNYEFKNIEYLFVIFTFIAKEFIKINKQNILDLFNIKINVENLKQSFLNKNVVSNNRDYKNKLDELKKEEARLKALIKKSLTIQNTYDTSNASNVSLAIGNFNKYLNKIYEGSDIQNKSLNEILIQELRYLSPMKFEEMIENWKNQCTKNNSNFMAIEYPQFAKPGGYQMAINAKPLFIKRCLQLCGGKSVVYIDGDMNIRKYPVIFDLKDVDYMARGWWIDPRSSYKFEESISYDPYTFETSGGTMFFSNSEESNLLLDMWIYESEKSYQSGKADDRIISMIFNSKKMLLNMKIIQLPSEYLWLTLDYNERLLESEIYDYNYTLMDSSIIIDHPECLTSEDTATGSGASSDRTPKFYTFLEDDIDPVSENFYECLEYPEIKYNEGLNSYLKYMSDVFYIDDGNDILYKKGYVEQNRDTSENEQPLYIYPYDKKFGNAKNELSDIIIKKSANMNAESLYTFDESKNLAEITNMKFTKEEDPQKPDTIKFLALMYKLLSEGKNVLYKPPTTNSTIYENLITNLDGKYKNTEFAFVPIFNGVSYNDIFRPIIDVNNCIYISYKSEFMKQFITIFESLEDIVEFINNGYYQLLSKVRVSYLLNKKVKNIPVNNIPVNNIPVDNSKIGGGNGNNISDLFDYETEYLDAMDYIENIKNGNKQGGYIKKNKKTIKKHLTKRNKKTKRHTSK